MRVGSNITVNMIIKEKCAMSCHCMIFGSSPMWTYFTNPIVTGVLFFNLLKYTLDSTSSTAWNDELNNTEAVILLDFESSPLKDHGVFSEVH